MRVRTEDLFRQNEALRKRVEELESVNRDVFKALRLANDQILNLAKRLKYIEDLPTALVLNEPFTTPPEG